MKKRKKVYKTIQIIVLAAIAFLLVVGATYAFYRTIDHINNDFKTSEYCSKVEEEFVSPGNWKPGDTTPKTITVTNHCDICQNVRVSYEEKWEDKDGNPIEVENPITLINFNDSTDWAADKGYYYYTKRLNSGETTASLLESVSYKKDIPNNFICETNDNIEKCTMAGGSLSGATYTITFKVETVECDANPWGVNIDNLGKRAIFDEGAIVNVKLKTLAGASNPTTDTVNTSMQKINMVYNSTCTSGSCVVVSSPTSPTPIYASFSSPLITFYTEASEAYLNDDASHMFENFKFLLISSSVSPRASGFSGINTSNTTNMSSMFKGDEELYNEGLAVMSDWDMSNVTTMNSMFYGCNSITSLSNLANWDVSKNTSLASTFRELDSLTSLTGLENWDVTSLKYMSSTFRDCTDLTDLSALANWQTSSLEKLDCTFYFCSSLTSSSLAGIKNWDVSHVTAMNSIFNTCSGITSLSNISSWDVSNVTTLVAAFRWMTSLTSLDGLSNWNVSNVTHMKYIFYEDDSLTNVSGINNWDIRKVKYTKDGADTNGFYQIFYNVNRKPTFSKRSGSWSTTNSYIPNNIVK